MNTRMHLGGVWRQVLGAAQRRRKLSRPTSAESLEGRQMPAIVNFTAVADGFARDANRDGVFERLDTTNVVLLSRNTLGIFTGIERSLLEFDLRALSNGYTIRSANLQLNVASRTVTSGVPPRLNFLGYTGNGAISLADATASGTLIGQHDILNTGFVSLALDPVFLASQGGNFTGVRVETPVLNSSSATFRSLEDPGLNPRLQLDVVLNVSNFEFNIDEHRPNGTVVGNVFQGNNLTYTILSGNTNNAFALNSTTGVITVANTAALEFDTQQQYVLNVRAAGAFGLTQNFTVTINVKNVLGVNHPPVVTPATFAVQEFSRRGTIVGQVQAVDPDSADPVRFAITGGNVNNAFEINPTTGLIAVRNQDALSLRTQSSFVLEVTAIDTREPRLTGSAPVTVLLSGRPDVSSQPNRVDVVAAVDGEARDANNDGVFESVNTTNTSIQVQRGAIGVTGRRGIFEFDLSGVNANKVVKGAFLTVFANATSGGAVPLSVFGYQGNGVVSAADAVAGTLIGAASLPLNTPADLRQYSIELDRVLVQQLIGTNSELGLVLRNDTNAASVTVDSLEGPAANGDPLVQRPTLHLILEDAVQDLVFRNTTNQQLIVAQTNGTSFTTAGASALRQGLTFLNTVTGDFNGDGRIDIASRVDTDGRWLVALASAQQFVTGGAFGQWTTATTFRDVLVGDFNGDGRDDIVGRTTQGQLLVSLSNGIAFVNTIFGNWDPTVDFRDVVVGDFNGDGLDDLAARNNTTGVIQTSLSTGTQFVTSNWGLWSNATTWSNVSVGDFNGDGLEDLIGRSTIGQFWVAESTGASFDNYLFANTPAGLVLSDIRIGDFNGDSRDDVVARSQTNVLQLFQSTGVGSTLINGGALPTLPVGTVWEDVVVGDFDRDGKDDLAARRETSVTVNSVTTTTQSLFVSLGSAAGPFTTSLFGSFTGAGPFELLGVGNF